MIFTRLLLFCVELWFRKLCVIFVEVKAPTFWICQFTRNDKFERVETWEFRFNRLDFGQFPASFRLEKHINTLNLDTFD